MGVSSDMADASALARAQLDVFEAAASREADRLRDQADAAPGLSRTVRWSAVYAAVFAVVQLVVEPAVDARRGVPLSWVDGVYAVLHVRR